MAFAKARHKKKSSLGGFVVFTTLVELVIYKLITQTAHEILKFSFYQQKRSLLTKTDHPLSFLQIKKNSELIKMKMKIKFDLDKTVLDLDQFDWPIVLNNQFFFHCSHFFLSIIDIKLTYTIYFQVQVHQVLLMV